MSATSVCHCDQLTYIKEAENSVTGAFSRVMQGTEPVLAVLSVDLVSALVECPKAGILER